MSRTKQDPVERWLSNLGDNTAKKYRQVFNDFMGWVGENGEEFAGFTPSDLILFQKKAEGDDKYLLLDDLIVGFVESKVNGRAGYKMQIQSVTKSFFKHSRAPLPDDPGYRIRSNTPKVEGLLTLEEIKNVVLTANPAYQAVFLSMFQGGMGKEEFFQWNRTGWNDLKEQLDDGETIIKIKIPGRKRYRNKKPYYTLIGRDAVNSIKRYIKDYRPDKDNAIFFNIHGNPITSDVLYRYWMRHLRKMGIIDPPLKTDDESERKSNRTGRGPHEIRDVFSTTWTKTPAKKYVCEFMMGHYGELDPNEYDKAYRDLDWVKGEYMKAEPYLNIISSKKPFGLAEEEEVQTLRGKIRELEDELDTRNDLTRTLEAESKDLRELVMELASKVEKIEGRVPS